MDACRSHQVETTDLTLPAPLGKRDVVIDSSGTFAPTKSTLMRRCSNLGGACTFPPVPSASCSNASYSAAMAATAPPQDADFNAVGCDSHWLVLDVGWPGGSSGCDGPSCGQNMAVTHWFFRAGPHGWITIASSLTAGCTRVHQVAPQFPTALCVSLPAVGPYAAASGTGTSHLPRGRGGGPAGPITLNQPVASDAISDPRKRSALIQPLRHLSHRASTRRPWGWRSVGRRRRAAVLRRRGRSRTGNGRRGGSPGGAGPGSPHRGRSRPP